VVLSALPENIAPLSLGNVHQFFSSQAREQVYFDEDSQRWVLKFVHPEKERAQRGLYAMTALWKGPEDNAVHATLREYARQTDAREHADLAPDSGMVDTSTWYSMLYTEDCEGDACRIQEGARFLSDFARGNEASPGYHRTSQSYAEAFAAYVTAGEVFRTLGEQFASFDEQYQWLRDNVFEGVEYCTGDRSLIVTERWDLESTTNLPQNFAMVAHGFSESLATTHLRTIDLADLVRPCR